MSTYQTEDITEQHHLLNQMARLVDEGKIRTVVTERLSQSMLPTSKPHMP